MRSSKEIRERIRKKEDNLGRQLTKNERRKIEKSVIRKHRRENFIRGLFLAAGVLLGAGGVKTLDSGKNIDNQPKQETNIVTEEKTKEDDFRESLHVSTENLNKQQSQNESIDYNQIEKELIDEYNQEYDDNLTSNKVSIIRSKPSFIGIDENNNYIQDYKEKTPVDKYISDNIGYVYIAVDKRNNKIISSVGKIDGEIVNIDTKQVTSNMDGKSKEYVEGDRKIDWTNGKDEDTIKNIYSTLKQEFEYQQELENQQKNEKTRW